MKILLTLYIGLTLILVLDTVMYISERISLPGHWTDWIMFWIWIISTIALLILNLRKKWVKVYAISLVVFVVLTMIPMMIPFLAILSFALDVDDKRYPISDSIELQEFSGSVLSVPGIVAIALNLKKTLPYLPEILLSIAIGISFFGEIIATSNVNYFMIGCGLVLSTLIIWKNKYLALSLSIILGLVSFYMLLAVFSEYHEFALSDRNGWPVLLGGGLIFISLLAISISLPGKYFKINKQF